MVPKLRQQESGMQFLNTKYIFNFNTQSPPHMSRQRSATQPQKSEAEYPKTMLKRAIAESRVLARPNLIIQIDSLYGKKFFILLTLVVIQTRINKVGRSRIKLITET